MYKQQLGTYDTGWSEVDQYDPNSHHVVLAANFSGRVRQAETVLHICAWLMGQNIPLNQKSHRSDARNIKLSVEIPSDIQKKLNRGEVWKFPDFV